MLYTRQEQGMSGVRSRKARHISKEKMDKIMINLHGKILGLKKGVRRLRVKQRRAMYAYCFSVIKRLAGAGHVIAAHTVRMPNNRGHVFNCTWDKTQIIDSHCFGFLCVKGKIIWHGFF